MLKGITLIAYIEKATKLKIDISVLFWKSEKGQKVKSEDNRGEKL